ncbi:MAG: hypothetical protein HFE63_11075 [Clostridiales bacterium]|nr:hypothetical protein [Clostridiales bacterium]
MSVQNGNVITIKEAAERMGKSEQFIRICLQQGIFGFGKAIKLRGRKKYTYYISPVEFERLVGPVKPDEV